MPENSKWQFTPIMREMAVWRLEVEAGDTSKEAEVGGKEGFMMAVTDIKT